MTPLLFVKSYKTSFGFNTNQWLSCVKRTENSLNIIYHEISDLAQPAEQLDIDSASGEIHINAGDKVKTVDIDTASGDVEAGFNKVPDSIKVDAASGNVTLRLPENANMTFDIDTASGGFESELPLSIKSGDKYVIGAGTSSAKIDTDSGDITIIKY